MDVRKEIGEPQERAGRVPYAQPYGSLGGASRPTDAATALLADFTNHDLHHQNATVFTPAQMHSENFPGLVAHWQILLNDHIAFETDGHAPTPFSKV
jgi:hypothetical protein